MENTIIKVDGMSCQGCVKNITGLLAALEGVGQVEVSLEAAEARVSFDGQKLSRADLCAAIEDAGFDAT
ncbi:heavy-metal-associated domain-containing protein [Azovibrio restrictus]|uniref:heavy-metal-associated domain-containing protein n=1 Tax=Azovibrio restrictus TaxID=146938 RepID=UPI0026F1902A|nr:copper ion binding protein [Azovibrio restrictus]